jgi:hypothetical protein
VAGFCHAASRPVILRYVTRPLGGELAEAS